MCVLYPGENYLTLSIPYLPVDLCVGLRPRGPSRVSMSVVQLGNKQGGLCRRLLREEKEGGKV